MPAPSPHHPQRLIAHLLALVALAGGLGATTWALLESVAGRGGVDVGIAALLLVAAIGCSRVPIRIGMGDSVISLDSIPLVLAVVVLPIELAIVVGAGAATASLVGQPHLPGLAGWFWRVQTVLSTAGAMGLVALGLQALVGVGDAGIVLFVPALIAAVALEAAFDLLVAIELEATEPGSWRTLLQTRSVIAANVLLPAIATAVLTPYLGVHVGWFAVLLPVLLAAMYGALWIANSQQLHKRRGDHLKATFSRYVPEGIVHDNLETMQRVELGGEQHEVSVLFCDLRGFTAWAEGEAAADVLTELNRLLTELSASVMAAGGTLDKFTGDGLMAFWGAPVRVPDHAARACSAALDMLARLDQFNEQRQVRGEAAFSIGIGIHSGPAVVGNVGHERRLDYTAIGDTVNTAARIEAATKDVGAALLVTRAVHDQLPDELRARAASVGSVQLKGKAEPLEAWRIDHDAGTGTGSRIEAA